MPFSHSLIVQRPAGGSALLGKAVSRRKRRAALSIVKVRLMVISSSSQKVNTGPLNDAVH
jgi:hypothetical protein